jgi:hypothetical protein
VCRLHVLAAVLPPAEQDNLRLKHRVTDLANKHISNARAGDRARVTSKGGLYDTANYTACAFAPHEVGGGIRIACLSLREGFEVLAKGAKLAGRIGSYATWLE